MDRLTSLVEMIEGKGDIAVAFSGGADSTLLAMAAIKSENVKTIGIMAVNDTIPDHEVEDAFAVAEEIGLDLEVIDIDVLDSTEFISNTPDRCGICRRITMPMIIDIAHEKGFGTIADGSNKDDLQDVRPGLEASTELGIWHPLIESGIGKKEVREILKRVGVSVHDRPSTPCLATRIPPEQGITREKLLIIDKTESIIRNMGFRQVRFRLHESSDGSFMGVVEVDDTERAIDLWEMIIRSTDLERLYLDPRGYRQGSLNSIRDP